MSQQRHSTRLLGAAITALVTASLVGVSGLVLCLGADGHRAIEIKHAGTGCPTLADATDAPGISTKSPTECFDLPATGADPVAVSSFDAGRVPMPPMAFLAVRLEPAPRAESLPASTDARAAPFHLALHLTSTILLV